MELRLRIEIPGAPVHDVFCDIDAERRVSDLAQALADKAGLPAPPGHLGLFCRRRVDWLKPSATIRQSAVRSGDELVLAPQGAALAGIGETPPALVLLVTGGPLAGLRFPLAPGTHQVGRSPECNVVLDDPSLSRVHLSVSVSRQGEITVVDERSANGTFVEGERLQGPVLLQPGQEIEAGRTLLGFGPSREPTVGTVDQHGRVALNRPPRMVPRPPQTAFKIDSPPEQRTNLAFSISAAVLPLGMGVVLWLATKQAIMLLMTLFSPVMVIGSWLEGRVGNRNSARRGGERFRERLAETSRQMSVSHEQEQRYRRIVAPDLARLALRAVWASPNLWERRQDDPDFLLLRVGWGDQASRLELDIPQGGDERLQQVAARVATGYQQLGTVPIAIPLREAGSIGVAGPRDHVLAMARTFGVQIATLHSPEEVMVAAALPAGQEGDWRWLGWIPHLRPESQPLPGDAIAIGRVAARDLVERLLRLLDERRATTSDHYGAQQTSGDSSIVVLLDGQAELPRAGVDRLLTEGPRCNINVIWLGATAQALPGECGAILDLEQASGAPTIVLPDRATTVEAFAGDLAPMAVADEVARALAPIRDVEAAGTAAEIPRYVSLLELLDLDQDPTERMRRRWARDDGRLAGRMGIAAGHQPCEVSIRYDGPHALAGGMTGSGKSELLQTLVASLAAAHSPQRLTFILVDYKGGAAFRDCIELPHTVGFVTDLDGHLVNRALVSLRAELRRREEVLRENGCRDLIEFEDKHPDLAFASLLIVVDEFAALAAELPDFVDGMVDIAQRGRSLGIHMILATQRPAGVINDKIRTNTNLRLALRFSDTSDSQDVIGTDDAARPGLPRGRAYMRAGPGTLIEFQAAYANGRTMTEGGPAPVVLRDLDVAGEPVDEGAGVRHDSASPTDLMRVVTTARDLNAQLELPPAPHPWLETLPNVLPLERLEAVVGAQPDERPAVTIGLLDDPARQRQLPGRFDLEQDGALVVFGATGTGKTTFLRALTASLTSRLSPDELHVYGLDFATRGLRPLTFFPHTGAIVSGDEIERGQRLLGYLRTEVDRRKSLLAAAGASTLAEYHAAGQPRLPHILLLLDGYGSFRSTYEDVDFGAPLDAFRELLADGRPMGLATVFTADRSGAVTTAVTASVPRRLVLRMTSDDEYSFCDVPRVLYHDAHLPAGRGFLDGQLELQCPIVGEQPSGSAQAAALDALQRDLQARYPDAHVPQIRLLPTQLAQHDLPAPRSPMEAVFGLLDGDLAPARLDLREDGHLLVVGPRRSGRSTTLGAIADSLQRAAAPVPIVLLAPRRQSPLLRLDGWADFAVGGDACATLAERLLAQARGEQPEGAKFDLTAAGAVVVIDDAEELFEGMAASSLEALARVGRDVDLRFAMATEAQAAHRQFGGLLAQVQRDRLGILLDADPTLDGTLVGGVTLPRRRGVLPPGRALFVYGGEVLTVQVAGEP
ncbi:MAG: FtsK/SpoIIIE domain-containing protein [Candidatus Dormiibacterota bacterium]